MNEEDGRLEEFLAARSAEGEWDGSSEISISLDDALRKMAAFQLPFPEGWILRLIQAVVSSGESSAVAVFLTAKCADINFRPSSAWGASAIVEAFLQPGAVTPPSLNYLVAGLRSLALHLKRKFWLRLCEEGRALHWSGKGFQVVEWSEDKPAMRVEYPAVRHFLVQSSQAKINADLLTLLVDRASVAPLPLSVDGLRVDSLIRPGIPLAFGWSNGDWPKWGVPQFCAEVLSKPHCWIQAGGEEFPQTVSLAYVVHSFLPHGKPSRSTCHWIRDGVVVDREPLLDSAYGAALDCFLSAEELESDISDFALRESSSRDDRRDSAARDLVDRVKAASVTPEVSAKLGTGGKVGLGVLGGLVVAWPMILVMISGVALPFGIAIVCDSFRKDHILSRSRAGLRKLKSAWVQRYG